MKAFSRFRSLATIWLGMAILVQACTPPVSFPAQSTRTPSPTATLPSPSPTVTLTSTPSPTPTATPIPTPDATLAHKIARAGLASVQARGGDAELLCLRYEDSDADGTPEWLALFHQNTTPARLSAFVLDGEAIYSLEPAFPKAGTPDVGLGEYATCEIEVRDINADGLPEIVIFGHGAKNTTLLHLFVWDTDHYRRLGFFVGDAGIRLVNADGDLEEEIWVGYREQNAPSLVQYVIHTWEEQSYGWTSDCYGWYFLNRPHTYPTHKPEYAVIAFYLALNERDLPGAYNLLLPQAERSYEAWAHGFATTVQVRVGSVHTVPDSETENSARVAAMITSWDNEQGVIVGRLWNTEWRMARVAEGWRLVSATTEMLEEWTAPYWP